MSTNVTLKATRREGTGKGAARKLRAAGKVPAVVYGKDMETRMVAVDAAEAGHLFQAISVENTIVDLQVEGSKGVPTLIREIQSHPLRPDLVHLDFYRVQAGVELEVSIPVHLTGDPEAVRAQGAVIEQQIHELPVRCTPESIPDSIEIDVSGLEVGESIHVGDVDLPEGVEAILDDERAICTLLVPRVTLAEEEEDEEALAEGALADAEGEESEGAEGEAEED